MHSRQIDLPFRFDIGGRVATTTDHARIVRNQLVVLLSTALNERMMLPEYGTRLRDAMFEPNDDALTQTVQTQLQEAVDRWLPNVSIISITSDPDPEDPGLFRLILTYSHYGQDITNSEVHVVSIDQNGVVVETEASGG